MVIIVVIVGEFFVLIFFALLAKVVLRLGSVNETNVIFKFLFIIMNILYLENLAKFLHYFCFYTIEVRVENL